MTFKSRKFEPTDAEYQALSGEHRACLQLAEQGKPYIEIAEALGIPPGTMRSRLHRARALMVRMRQNSNQAVVTAALERI